MPAPAVTIDALAPFLDLVTDGAYSHAQARAKTQPAGKFAVVYGPGRGLFHDGKWYLTVGPGALGLPSKLVTRHRTPSLHCSSFTALCAGVATGRDAAWDHKGTMADLSVLLTQDPWRRKLLDGQVVTGRGYAGCFDEVAVPGALRGWSGGAALVRVLLEKAGPQGALYLLAQSTRRKGGWVWGHHTLGCFVRPGASHIVRVAADGFRNNEGLYSATPMDAEVWSLDPAQCPDPAKTLYRAWRLRDSALRPSKAPIVLES